MKKVHIQNVPTKVFHETHNPTKKTIAFHLDMDCQKITSVFTLQKSITAILHKFSLKGFHF
jgi:hypothetical protein